MRASRWASGRPSTAAASRHRSSFQGHLLARGRYVARQPRLQPDRRLLDGGRDRPLPAGVPLFLAVRPDRVGQRADQDLPEPRGQLGVGGPAVLVERPDGLDQGVLDHVAGVELTRRRGSSWVRARTRR